MTSIHPARRMWQLLEPLHAVVYFDDSVTAALKNIGLRGFWMGYFAQRAAPLGPVGPGPVEATFYNFAPAMVQRAIPDAWRFAAPPAVLTTRAVAAASVLRRLVPNIESEAQRVVPLLTSAVRSARADGRTLFAANQQLPLPEDPVAALWQCATSLREHRGDSHVALLVANDLSGLDVHILAVADGRIGEERIRDARGWSAEEWARGTESLEARGLLDDHALTPESKHLIADIEDRTDELANQPFADGLTEAGFNLLPSLLKPLATAVTQSGLLPYPNPIGLPELDA